MRDRRGPWYLLTGLALGIGLGLAYAWLVRPVQYTNTYPATLRADYKDRYRALVASAFMANRDVGRAKARLEQLKESDLFTVLAGQAQRTLAEGSSPAEARALGLLAVALGQAPAPASPQNSPAPSPSAPDAPSSTAPPVITGTLPITTSAATPTQVQAGPSTVPLAGPSTVPLAGPSTVSPSAGLLTSTPGASPTPLDTPLPTRTPVPTPSSPFRLDSQEKVCDPNLAAPLLQVITLDADGNPVPGVEVTVSWDNSSNRFFTGLKPELGLGYADYTMEPGITYTLQLTPLGRPVSDLSAPECEKEGGERYWGSWKLVFGQP